MKEVIKTNWRKQFFNWHMWSGVIFTIPLILVSLTAILIAHEKGFGTKEVAVNAGWLPGYSSEENISHYLDDVKDVLITEGKTYYASKLGVIIENNKNISILKGTEGKEIRDLQLIDNKLWIASKKGLFLMENGNATFIKKGDFHGINNNQNLLIASEGKYGFHTSTNSGKTWITSNISKTIGKEKTKEFSASIEKSKYVEELTLEKLALDIHTGKAFFGEGSMWIWIDLIGISLLFMTFTGIWMWYKRKYGKKKKK
jgi:hypothetical protein